MAIQRNFAAGEIAPSLGAGADAGRYNSALATCRNFLVTKSGGVANRPGTPFVAEVKNSAARTYLAKFVFNNTDTYVIEMGNLYLRFYQLGARVVVSAVTAWSALTNYVAGDVASSGGVNYYCILAHINFVPPNATYWYALTTTIFEIPTPYVTADLATIQYVQSGDIVTLVHPNYAPRELRRYASRWTLSTVVTAPTIGTPASLAATAGAAGALVYRYVVTAIASETYEESLPSTSDDATGAVPTAALPNTLAWTATTGAVEYNVYLDLASNGKYGFIGVASTNAFNDIGYIPDMSLTPPVARSLFATTNNYPATVSYYQQRRLFGGTNTQPETAFASRTGFFKNFTISSPIQDDDAITFTVAGRLVSLLRHLIDVGKGLVILTSTGEWVVLGDQDGVLRPTAINLKQQAYWGSAEVMPVVVGSSLVYVQARGGILRDLKFFIESDGYEGRDLTLFASHLVDGYAIERLDYAQMPNSIIWCVRSDGTLLGLTYVRDTDTWGWHHHDTSGVFEDVIAIPETTPPPPGSAIRGKEEDAVYVIVKRTINGATKRYIERFASRRFEDYRLDGLFLDCSATYNGINAGATTMTLTTGAGWTTADLITVTASAGTFVAGDVGNGITVWNPSLAGTANRIVITAYVSATVVQGNPIATVAASLRNAATLFWSRAVDEVSGLSHLEAAAVTCLANGVVITGEVVTAGVVSLSNLYDVIHIGLPITADFETLDIDDPQQSIRDRKKLITSASLLVERSRGITAGPDSDHLLPYFPETGTALGLDIFEPTGGELISAIVECNLTATWQKPGRVFVRQTEPLPLTILAVLPDGRIGG